jgi:DNA-binding response OmpR family regulator
MAAPVIAIIDHDEAYARLVTTLLAAEGFETRVLEGTNAYQEIADDPPDVLLIDTWLSHKDEGMAVLQMMALGQRTNRVPILVTTSDDSVGLEGRIMALPAPHVVLVKPFPPEKLLSSLNQLLDTSLPAK